MSADASTPTRVPKYRAHPLSMRFMSRCYTTREGLNWLQEHGWISDQVTELAEVAAVDAQRVCSAFDNYWRLKGARMIK